MGGDLPTLIGEEFAQELIDYTDKIYLEFGADPHVEGIYTGEDIKDCLLYTSCVLGVVVHLHLQTVRTGGHSGDHHRLDQIGLAGGVAGVHDDGQMGLFGMPSK